MPPVPQLPRLDLDASGPSSPSARLADFVWGGATPDHALHGSNDGTRALVRTRRLPAADGADPASSVRWVEHFELERTRVVATDLIRFDLDPLRFAETGRWTAEDDRNLHRRPMVLPAELRLEDRILPIPGARITLGWVGLGTLTVGTTSIQRRLLRLCIEQGGVRMDQWFAEGVGEIATGPAYGPFGRWLLGWEGGGERLFRGIEGIDPSALPNQDLDREGVDDPNRP